MPKYRVHIMTVVRVPVDVEAANPMEAAALAEDLALGEASFGQSLSGLPVGLAPLLPGELRTEYVGEIVDFLVDEEGDEEHERSRFVLPAEVHAFRTSVSKKIAP